VLIFEMEKGFRESRPLPHRIELTVITCICVGVYAAALVIDLVAGLLAGTGGLVGSGRFSHFSMIIVLAVRLTEKSKIIFTSSPEFSSQRRASRRSLVSDSDHPDSKTMVGQSTSRGRILRGLKAESPS
jgi:hypothetical protein